MAWLNMPLAVLLAYMRRLSDLQGQEALRDAVAATFPHMEKKDRRKLMIAWGGEDTVVRDMTPEERRGMIASVGITIER